MPKEGEAIAASIVQKLQFFKFWKRLLYDGKFFLELQSKTKKIKAKL